MLSEQAVLCKSPPAPQPRSSLDPVLFSWSFITRARLMKSLVVKLGLRPLSPPRRSGMGLKVVTL